MTLLSILHPLEVVMEDILCIEVDTQTESLGDIVYYQKKRKYFLNLSWPLVHCKVEEYGSKFPEVPVEHITEAFGALEVEMAKKMGVGVNLLDIWSEMKQQYKERMEIGSEPTNIIYVF